MWVIFFTVMSMRSLWRFASRMGSDPMLNRIHPPMVYHSDYSFDGWPASHTFPMDKFACLAETLLNSRLVRHEDDFFQPLQVPDIPRDWFSIVDSDYLDRFLSGSLSPAECRAIGFREQTAREPLIARTLLEVAGTVLTAQLALRNGIAANLAGGTHHAHPHGGAGYTVLNDLAVTAHVMASENRNKIGNVLVIDVDVHQGDGTAKFGSRLSNLYTLSLHCESNYPHPKANSTYDVGLRDGMEDSEYLEILESAVEIALREVQPDLVLYDAGVDVFVGDTLGRLNLSLDGIRCRDRYVLDRCVRDRIPVAAVIGGGYDKDVKELARRHAIVHEECSFVWQKYRMWERAQPLA